MRTVDQRLTEIRAVMADGPVRYRFLQSSPWYMGEDAEDAMRWMVEHIEWLWGEYDKRLADIRRLEAEGV